MDSDKIPDSGDNANGAQGGAEISSEEPTTLSPSDSVEEAVRLMRDKAIRRVPVVDGDRPVGIVSIGDLAVERDPRSVLADISSEPPNR